MIGASTFVTCCWAWPSRKPSTKGSAVTSTVNHSSSASSKRWTGLKSGIRTSTLSENSAKPEMEDTSAFSQRDDQVDHRNSTVLQFQLHLFEGLDNQLEHDQDLDSGNTAWLEETCQIYLPHITFTYHGHLLSVVRGCGQPLDSCPVVLLGRCLGCRDATKQMPMLYQVVCLAR